ncbi:hypothetical protein OG320_22110 [Microbispora sp. NBC_01189]|uniref:hypothetical protein n=1 Tax=Microbispora sp. NBC_01189 TaxID=2903583 RepID=UPI002E10B05C|nr:hypothetical protein OG320_22110 [Microbispora sp. NBC_01189]
MRRVQWTARAVWIVVPLATVLLSIVTMAAAATPGVRWVFRAPVPLGWLLLFCAWLTAILVGRRHRPVFTAALTPIIALVTLVTDLFLERYGMAYLPKGADDGGEFDELDRHLGGDWYLWMTD